VPFLTATGNPDTPAARGLLGEYQKDGMHVIDLETRISACYVVICFLTESILNKHSIFRSYNLI
jgi:hypothetical protein